MQQSLLEKFEWSTNLWNSFDRHISLNLISSICNKYTSAFITVQNVVELMSENIMKILNTYDMFKI